MFVAIALVISIIIPIYTRLARMVSRFLTITIINLISAGSILVFYFSMHDIMIPVFYVWMEIVVILTGLQLWGLAGNVFNPMQAKRLFPLLSAGGSFAAIVVGMSIRPVVEKLGSETLMLGTVIFLIIGIFVSSLAKPFIKEEPTNIQVQDKKSKNKQGFNKYLWSIAIMVGLSALVSTLVDYQFKITASTQFQSDDLAGFFGMYYAITGAAGLFIQLFIVSRLLSRLGVLAGLLILPVFLLFGSTTFLILPGLLSISAAKFSDQTFKYTVHNTASQLLWLPVPAQQRSRTKPIISGTIKTAIEGLAGVTTFFAIKFINIQQLSFIAIAFIVIWVVVTFFLKGGYIKTLETAIEKRQLDFSTLQVDSTDKAMVKTLDNALLSGDIHQQHFALELMEGLTLTPWKSSLLEIMETAPLEIRVSIMNISKDDINIIPDDQILGSIKALDDLVVPSIKVAAYRKIEQAVPELNKLLVNDQIQLKTIAAYALLHISNNEDPAAKDLLDRLIDTGNDEEQLAALRAVKGLNGFLSYEKINSLLGNDSFAVRTAALELCNEEKNEAFIPAIFNNIRSNKTAVRAREILYEFQAEMVLEKLSIWLSDRALTISEKINIAHTLKHYSSPDSIKILLTLWNHRELLLCDEIADSLLAIARERSILPDTISRIDRLTKDLARGMYEETKILVGISKEGYARLLTDYITRRIDRTMPIILKLGVLDIPETKIETYIHYIKIKDQEHMPFLYELLDTIFNKTERQAILPLITPRSNMDRVKTGHRLFPDLSKIKINQQLETLLQSSNPWESAITAFYILQDPAKSKMIPKVFEVGENNELMLETIQFIVHQRAKDLKEISIPEKFRIKELPNMYSTLEKTLILKSVPLFQSIPGNDLSRVARIAEEAHYTGDENIFKEGDPGHSMYIIINGEILIHRDQKKIAVLKKGECLGEMALLDQEPRSADATVNNEATLLKINQEGFFELMSGNLEIMRGIIKLLTNRLRTAIA